MVVHGDVDVVEMAVAHEIGTAQELLLGGRSEDFQGSRETELLHRALGRDRARDHDRAVDVVALAVSRGAWDDLGPRGRAGRLRVLGVGVVFGVHGDHRPARAEGGEKRRREPRDAALDREALILEQPGQEPRRLVLLHPDLAEIEDAVSDGGDGLSVSFDDVEDEGLLRIDVRRCHGVPPLEMNSDVSEFRVAPPPRLTSLPGLYQYQ